MAELVEGYDCVAYGIAYVHVRTNVVQILERSFQHVYRNGLEVGRIVRRTGKFIVKKTECGNVVKAADVVQLLDFIYYCVYFYKFRRIQVLYDFFQLAVLVFQKAGD